MDIPEDWQPAPADGWLPKNGGDRMAGVDFEGNVVEGRGRKSRLRQSPNPIVRRIGAWIEATPPGREDISAFGGLLIGLRIGARYGGGAVQQLLDAIHAEARSGGEQQYLDAVVDGLVQDDL